MRCSSACRPPSLWTYASNDSRRAEPRSTGAGAAENATIRGRLPLGARSRSRVDNPIPEPSAMHHSMMTTSHRARALASRASAAHPVTSATWPSARIRPSSAVRQSPASSTTRIRCRPTTSPHTGRATVGYARGTPRLEHRDTPKNLVLGGAGRPEPGSVVPISGCRSCMRQPCFVHGDHLGIAPFLVENARL